jgi:hypothetical protein
VDSVRRHLGLRTEDDEQVAHHRRLLRRVERDDLLLVELIERELDHPDRPFDDPAVQAAPRS